jgi:putative ABC transport system substrate-binding protein
MSSRRNVLIMLGAVSVTPRTAFSQTKKPPVLIGWLHGGTSSGLPVTVLKQEMAALGWKDGENYVLEVISAEGRVDELPTLARSLAAKKPVLIVTSLDPATVAAAKATPNVPVIQVLGGSPVEHGLAAGLARPGVKTAKALGLTMPPEIMVQATRVIQ